MDGVEVVAFSLAFGGDNDDDDEEEVEAGAEEDEEEEESEEEAGCFGGPLGRWHAKHVEQPTLVMLH